MRQAVLSDGHRSPAGSMHDEYWTPRALFSNLCARFGFRPEMDYAASAENTKCPKWSSDSLHVPWELPGWLNPPNSKLASFTSKAFSEWAGRRTSLLLLVPFGVLCRRSGQAIWDAHLMHPHICEILPLYSRPRFLDRGRPLKTAGHNDYCAIMLRGRDQA